jgi:hypothetical protein
MTNDVRVIMSLFCVTRRHASDSIMSLIGKAMNATSDNSHKQTLGKGKRQKEKVKLSL